MQLTPAGLVKILGQVTAIMVGSLVGGTVVGLFIDAALGTSPTYALIGLAVGNLAAIVGLWLYIGAKTRHAPDKARREDGADRS